MHVLDASAVLSICRPGLARSAAGACLPLRLRLMVVACCVALLGAIAPSAFAQQSMAGGQPGTRLAHGPALRELAPPANWSPVHKATALVAGQRCVQRPEGRVECRRADNGAFVYTWPVTPDMVGQTVDAVALTPGVTIFPPIQRIAPGQTQLTLEIAGAKPGDGVRLLQKLMSPGSGKGGDGDVCCDVEHALTVPQARTCTQPVSLLDPSRRPRATPTVPQRPQVAIDKQCAVCVPGAGCTCRVTVRNLGSDATAQPVGFRDETRDTSTNAVVKVASFKPDGPDWRCTQTDVLACELPARGLKPLTSRSVTVVLEPQPLGAASGGRLRNCATLRGEGANGVPSTQRESCSEVGADIVVSKSATPRCRQGEQCSFDIAIANRGQGPFDGPVAMCDAFSLDGVGNARATIVSVEPSLGCAGGVTSTPFNCQANLQIDKGEARTFRMTLRLPQPEGKGQERAGRVCFGLFAPAAGAAGCQAAGAAASNRRQATPAGSATSLNAGAACVDFVSLPRCPGDLVLQGSQCGCPNNMERFGDDSCRAACAQGQRREGNACVSPQPTYVPPPVVNTPAPPPRAPNYGPPSSPPTPGPGPTIVAPAPVWKPNDRYTNPGPIIVYPPVVPNSGGNVRVPDQRGPYGPSVPNVVTPTQDGCGGGKGSGGRGSRQVLKKGGCGGYGGNTPTPGGGGNKPATPVVPTPVTPTKPPTNPWPKPTTTVQKPPTTAQKPPTNYGGVKTPAVTPKPSPAVRQRHIQNMRRIMQRRGSTTVVK